MNDKWQIDESAGRPILVFEGCSVIEGEQAKLALKALQSFAALQERVKALEADAKDECAWLVEQRVSGYAPQWWGFPYTAGKEGTWCKDASDAIHFSRKRDAEQIRLHIIACAGLTGNSNYERAIVVTEHMFCAALSTHENTNG